MRQQPHRCDHRPPVTFVDARGQHWWRTNTSLGKGQYGEVFLGLLESGEFCAMKLIRIQDDFNVDAIVREVEAMADIRHINVADYLSCAVGSEYFCIVMELLPGGTLRSLMSHATLPVAAVLKYLREVASGLNYLHAAGIVHRDIKPDNVLFSGDGTCKVADFGTALVTEASVTATVRGTPRYMPPEACVSQWSRAGDVFSLSIMAAELLSGKQPWAHIALSDTNFLMRLSRDETMVPAPLTLDAVVAEERTPQLARLVDLINRGMSREPQRRPSLEELLDVL